MNDHSQPFVHLHVHSEYSLLESSIPIEPLIDKASELGMPALALTDNGNLFGAIEFYFGCLAKNIKPIIGMDAYFASHGRKAKIDPKAGSNSNDFKSSELYRQPPRILLLAQSYTGYQNLCRLSTLGYQEGFYYKPRIDWDLLNTYNEDLLCLSGGIRGEIPISFFSEGPEVALKKIKQFQEIFRDRFYLEIQRSGLQQWKPFNDFLLESSQMTGVPLVATNDVHFLSPEDQVAQEVLICIGTNKILQDETRYRLGSDQFYFKSAHQMRTLFADYPEVCDRTLEIANRCQIKFHLKDDSGKPKYHLPSYPTQNDVPLHEEIKALAEKGLSIRFEESTARNEIIEEAHAQLYKERLEYELNIINRMGFNGYFLIVSDFINWAKSKNIPVGPGRGSGAGSLVAYALRITDLDPMPYQLLFERFLNPERISMPDFDIDFCQDRRQEVIHYVTEKYGARSVSQIITYGKLQCRAAIKDVGRVMGMTFSEVDSITKLVPEKLNITIQEAIDQEPRLRDAMEANPQVATLLDLAKRIEGLVRHVGIHAAGVVIADGELTRHAPLYKGSEGENVLQFDMKHAEKIGLIKFDFLGLKTLTHIQYALDLVETNRQKKIRTQDISINDPGIYEIMSAGDTAGIFQFEGEGITSAMRQIRPTNFFDITAINALYRPGPMAMIPEYTKRKHNESPVEYIIPETQSVLRETYGIIIYQEQVMGIASLIAGYSLGEADMLRRAMGKKKKEEMDLHRERFLRGALERGHELKKSEELFELMYKFADYGFNKSHAAAYCVIAAQTAWLKKYYPAEFYAALLSTEMNDTDKVVKYVKDAQKHGLKVLPPHVNASEYLFTVKGDDIYFGLGAIKGIGSSAISAIVEARGHQPEKKFKDLNDFFNQVDIKKLNKKVIECLIKAGALDSFGCHRAQMMNGYPQLMEKSELGRKDKEIGQYSFFDLIPQEEEQIQLAPVKTWSRSESLSFEKEILGFYLSGHPLLGYEHIARVWITGTISELGRIQEEHLKRNALDNNKQKYDFRNREGNKKRVIVYGILTEMRESITKKGTRMAFARIEDLTGSVDLIVFPDVYIKFSELLKEDRPLLIGGYLESDSGMNLKIMVDNMALLESVFKKTQKLKVRLELIPEDSYEKLRSLMLGFPGSTQIQFSIFLEDLKQEVTLQSDLIKGVQLSNLFFETINEHFGRTDFIQLH